MSAPAYFAFVLLVTMAGIGAAMLTRPLFGHAILQQLGLEQPRRALPGSFYAERVQPLFDTHCIACHGARRQKGELRLDSFAAARLGGRSGRTVEPGDPKASQLMIRIELPPSDDRAMPPSGKLSLTPDEATVIRLWIAGGARGDQAAAEVKNAPKLVRPAIIPEIDPASVTRQRAPLARSVLDLQARLPGMVYYESRNSADLTVNASLAGARFGDREMALLAPIAARITQADFSGTAISDASASALAAMTALKSLRLANTKITGATVAALGPLKKLRTLTLVGTGVTAPSSLRQKGVTIYADTDVQ